MKDPKARAFRTLLATRGRITERLQTQLAEERREHERLRGALNEALESLSHAVEAERVCDASIDAMIGGTSTIRLPNINAQRQHRETLREQCAVLERRRRECSDAVARQEAEMAKTRQRIARNDHSIEIYRGQLDMLRKLADARSEDLALEEAEEFHTIRGRRGAIHLKGGH